MFFIRIGNGKNFTALREPYDVFGALGSNTWALKQWRSAVTGMTVNGVSIESLPRRERSEGGLIPPAGSLGFVISWNDELNAAAEVLYLSTPQSSSFYYRELVVTVSREEIRIAGFRQDVRLGIVYEAGDPKKIAHIEVPMTMPQRLSSLEELRRSFQRNPFPDFIDRRGTGKLW